MQRLTYGEIPHPCFARMGHPAGSVGAAILLLLGTGCAPGGLRSGEDARGAWWMRETAMTRDGRIDLIGRSWWSQAKQLKNGQQFNVAADGEAADHMLVRRETVKRRTGATDAIVWVIDDGGDGSIRTGGDAVNDCYVVDYGCDGIVDRMVDYIDSNRDGIADEMDIRYFEDGELRRAWFGLDCDHDGQMWDLLGYEYSCDFFKSDPYGDNMIYMNKYNPEDGTWVPISECPFAFYDTDRDGQSEVVVRVSAVPMGYNASIDPDYANDASRYQGKWGAEQRHIGICNIRYSFDVDKLSSKETPLHYDFGFNLVGATPYEFAGMRHVNAMRRPPQTTCVIPYASVRSVSDRFQARETGFSWSENVDDTIAIGAPPRAEDDWRWEGVFWIWERRFMENTGGPNQKWNVRREWSRKPTNKRELYYSGVDGRIHLFGAEEGWLEIGHFNGLGRIGEVRMYDTDGNGFFDRWEVWLEGGAAPARVTTVRDEKARRIPFDYERLCKFYTEQALPQAMAANAKLAGAMSKVREFAPPEALKAAMETGPLSHRRYAQDVVIELRYQDLRRHFTEQADAVLAKAKFNDLRLMKKDQRDGAWNTQTAWQTIRLLERLDAAYGGGDAEQACALLGELETLWTRVKS